MASPPSPACAGAHPKQLPQTSVSRQVGAHPSCLPLTQLQLQDSTPSYPVSSEEVAGAPLAPAACTWALLVPSAAAALAHLHLSQPDYA